MFIDLYRGTLQNSSLIDTGAVKVEYWFTNLDTTASFNVCSWCAVSPNQGSGINFVQATSGSTPSGYTVNYTPVTPVADFTADNTTGSDPLTVKFTDTSAKLPNYHGLGILETVQHQPNRTQHILTVLLVFTQLN